MYSISDIPNITGIEFIMTAHVPLYQAKTELFRTLGHPVRIRVLELLQAGPRPVHELLSEIDVESSNLSQQLAVLRRAGLVSSSRNGSAVLYTLSTPDVAQLLLSSCAGATRSSHGKMMSSRSCIMVGTSSGQQNMSS
jgi:ArsR family transcriptional regulator